jgi:abequosyltransferase
VDNIKLSFCIATLNRGALIGATLDSIIFQATEEVEIVIVDGASTDNTEDVVQRRQERFARLRYHRQNANLGVDHDFAEAVAMASGEYCWLFSDDDLLKPGAIQTVLGATKGQYGLIIANAEVRNADLSKLLESKRLQLSANRIYRPTQNGLLLTEVGNYLTFVGGVVIKRELWNAREKEKYFGSLFVHAGVIFQSPLPEDTLVIAEPLISIRYGNASWLGKYFEIWMFKWPELVWSFLDYPDSVKLQVCHKEPWRSMRLLMIHRAKGAFTIKEYLKWLEPRLDSSWTRAATKAIAQFPGRVANFLGIAYFHTFRRQPDWVLQVLDLENSPFYFWKWRKQRRQRTNAEIP